MAEIDYLTKPNIITSTPLKLFGFNIHNISEENDSDSSKLIPIWESVTRIGTSLKSIN
jgi:hypothetical protein